jgi:Tfp pilus assembly protein PilO
MICGYLAVNYGTKQQRQIQQEIELFSKTSKGLNLAETTLKRLRTTSEKVKRSLTSLDSRFPDSAKIGEFVKELDVLMKEKEIAMLSVQPQPYLKEKLYTKIPIRLMFTGPFVKIFELLYDLEHMNRTVVMEKMIMSRASTAQECRVDLWASLFER